MKKEEVTQTLKDVITMLERQSRTKGYPLEEVKTGRLIAVHNVCIFC